MNALVYVHDSIASLAKRNIRRAERSGIGTLLFLPLRNAAKIDYGNASGKGLASAHRNATKTSDKFKIAF